MNDALQNLARALRPTTFEEIIGQTLTVRMLRNSLYLRSLFPVYLFAGQRGCGKTTTARVFAAAINCAQYEQFIASPSTCPIPCKECDSCRAMREGRHPDFIEIDAASHTGVDHVRSLLEGAVHAPLMGRTKIYLIDEVHMLSKAAFNALLKMLEEPPASVLFLLATTEREKIPETVRSRSFQLFFDPLPSSTLTAYLRTVCDAQGIVIDDEALLVLVQQSEGSVRDALNALERVRFFGERITADIIYETLGYIRPEDVIQLFEHIIAQDVAGLLAALASLQVHRYDPTITWKLVVELVRALVWLRNAAGVPTGPFESCSQQLERCAKKCSADRLRGMLQLLWDHEPVLLKTTTPGACLEYILLLLCQQVSIDELEARVASLRDATSNDTTQRETVREKIVSVSVSSAAQHQPAVHTPSGQQDAANDRVSTRDPRWEQFCVQVRERVADPLLHSIVQQAQFIEHDGARSRIVLGWRGNGKFFEEALRDRRAVLSVLLIEVFGAECSFEASVVPLNPERPVERAERERPVERDVASRPLVAPAPAKRRFESEEWPLANLVADTFPGTLEIIDETEKLS